MGLENRKDNFVVGKTQSIDKLYKLGKQLGQPGQFGVARLAKHIKSGKIVAVKIISKAKFRDPKDRRRHFKQLRDEIRIMTRLKHPNIIKFTEVFEDNTKLFIVMECCKGGELFDRIKAQEKGSYSEKDAVGVLRQVCDGIKYLHENKIAHCDLKPDNFLFLDNAKDSALKIIDFGMSKFVGRREYLHSFRGTPYYVAPEVLSGQYAEHCDMWSFGVIMFVMLFGYPPFSGADDDAIFDKIEIGFTPTVQKGYGAYFPERFPISEAARDLIGKCLEKDQGKRISAAEAMAHPWLTGERASDKPIELEVLKNLADFTGKCRLKAVCADLFSNVLTDDELESLKVSFAKIDTNGDGNIDLHELKAAAADNRITGGDAKNVEKLLAAADLDGDGMLSYKELLATSVQRKLLAKEERLWNAFCMLDVDGDGSVTIAELEKVLGESKAELEAMLKEVDGNNDGKVDYEEFMGMWEAKHFMES